MIGCCCCLQGGLPTFLDVGQSFSASALSEDNLLQQLQAQGKRMVRSSSTRLIAQHLACNLPHALWSSSVDGDLASPAAHTVHDVAVLPAHAMRDWHVR
jgi:hypothetical protein